MKQNYLKSLLVMLLMMVGMGAWATATPATMATGTSGSTAKVNEKNAIKVGTSSKGGDMTITVPANSTSLTFYAAAWKGVSDLSLNITPAAKVKTTSVTLNADTGIANSTPFTLAGDEDDFKFTIDLNNITKETTLTLTAEKRFVVWGATAEVVNNQTYAVTFSAGSNGTCSISSLTESAPGAGVTLPNVTAKTGFDFVGWSTDETPASANAGKAGDTYNPTSNCTLYAYYTVPRPANEVFYESFDTNDGTGGNDGSWSGTIASNSFKSDNTWTVANANGANYCAKFGTGSALGSAQTPRIAASGNFTLTFKAAAWNGASESTTLKLSATNATLSASSVTLTKGAWDTYSVKITNATEGFTIKFEGNKTSNSRFFLDEVSIVTAAPTATITLNAACTDGAFVYGTYSNASAWVVPSDVFVFAVWGEDGTIATEDFSEGEVVPANYGVLVAAEKGGDYDVALSNEEGTDPTDGQNLLRATGDGIDADAMAAANPNCKYYRLTMQNGSKLGFWWGAADGAAFALAANKAYLAMPITTPIKAQGLWFNTEETAIQNVENAAPKAIYDLQGRKVSAAQKGLYIINGKKVVK